MYFTFLSSISHFSPDQFANNILVWLYRNDEYWGTIFRSDRIAQIIRADGKLNLNDVQAVEHDIGTIDGDDVMRPAAPYFLPFL